MCGTESQNENDGMFYFFLKVIVMSMSNIVTESAFNLYKFTAVAASELKNRVCLYITDTVAVYHKHLIGVMMGY